MVSHDTGATQTPTTDPRLDRTPDEMRKLFLELLAKAPEPRFPHESC